MEPSRHHKSRSEVRLRELYEEAPVIYVTAARDGTITSVNRAGAESLGYQPEELLGSSVFSLYASGPSGNARATALYRKLLAGEEIRAEQLEIRRADGSAMWGSFTGHAVRTSDGSPRETLTMLVDVTARKQAEDAARSAVAAANQELRERLEQLTSALSEKEVLLRELHHRVKNNLQVISSLLNLQARRISDEGVLELFRESQNRVAAIALFHERVFRSEDLAHIGLGEYLEGIVQQVEIQQRTSSPPVSFKTENIKVGVDVALPCGLIVNELVCNAFKQARERGNNSELSFTLERTDAHIRLVFTTTPGKTSSESLDPSAIAKGGIDLVETLVEQLRGTMQTNENSIELTFALVGEEH